MAMIKDSNQISKLFRPIFEARQTRSVFGALLSVASLILAVGIYPSKNLSALALEPIREEIEVETALTGPIKLLPKARTISQGFRSAHLGVDITAEEGSPIYPLKKGKVKVISISKFNYGRSVLVEHDDEKTSLYAHMGKIFVDEGDEVTEETILGEVGMTGRTTGPHLHFEVRKNGAAQNPMRYLGSNTLASK